MRTPKQLALRVARRLYRHAPAFLTRRLGAMRTRLAFSLHAGQIAPDPAAARWFAAHGRPFSIVIPSYNDVPLLTQALASIKATCTDLDYEVIVVDDFIDPAVQQELLALQDDRVRVILKDARRGFAGTVNVGMAAARHDIVLLNSDTVAQPGWVQALQRAAYAVDPLIGIVSAKLVYPDGGIQYAGTYYARLLAPQWFGHLHVLSPAGKPVANVAGYNTSASGACMYVTRTAYEVLGGLDDEFWLGFEDVDYGLRAWQRGIRCYYEPSAMLIHHESASRGYSQGHRELASMRRFWRRWESRFLARRLPDDYTVDFVLHETSAPLWARYVRQLADDLEQRGHASRVHTLAEARPESIIADLAARTGVVVACDHRAAETVWLAAASGSPAPVYLLPSVESELHPEDPDLQARIIAGYRSDFDFVAPNRWTARQLQAETAWESTARVAPALTPPPASAAASMVLTIGASAREQAAIDAIVHEAGLVAEHRDMWDADSWDQIVRTPPLVVTDLRVHANSLESFALMASGAALATVRQPRLAHEVLDGYNSLQFDRDDEAALTRAVFDLVTRPSVRTEISGNGRRSAERAAEMAKEDFAHALDAVALSVL